MTQERANWDWIDARVKRLEAYCFSPERELSLTDGEVTILANKYLHYIECDYESTGIYEFARAILREAQQK